MALRQHLVAQVEPFDHCFVKLPAQLCEILRRRGAQVVALEVSFPTISEDGQERMCRVHAGWNGLVSRDQRAVVFSHHFAATSAIEPGTMVGVTVLDYVPVARMLCVEPVDEDSSEILEMNQGFLEHNLLAQVQVVAEHQVVPIHVRAESVIYIRILPQDAENPGNSPQCFVLKLNTELSVALKMRKKVPNHDDKSTALSKSIQARVRRHKIIRVRPLAIAGSAWRHIQGFQSAIPMLSFPQEFVQAVQSVPEHFTTWINPLDDEMLRSYAPPTKGGNPVIALRFRAKKANRKRTDDTNDSIPAANPFSFVGWVQQQYSNETSGMEASGDSDRPSVADPSNITDVDECVVLARGVVCDKIPPGRILLSESICQQFRALSSTGRWNVKAALSMRYVDPSQHNACMCCTHSQDPTQADTDPSDTSSASAPVTATPSEAAPRCQITLVVLRDSLLKMERYLQQRFPNSPDSEVRFACRAVRSR